MLKKIIWVFMLLLMTACTILFKDGVEIVLGELTPTAISSPTMEVISATAEVMPTIAPKATEAPTLEPTPAALPTATPEATPTPFDAEYVVQAGAPVYLDNFAHPVAGCDWQGVAGQVFSASGEPILNRIVKVAGIWNDKDVAMIGITGMADGLPYGPGGYEILLGETAVNSVAPLFVQVFDDTQKPLTEPFPITTKSDCKKNLLIVNFVSK